MDLDIQLDTLAISNSESNSENDTKLDKANKFELEATKTETEEATINTILAKEPRRSARLKTPPVEVKPAKSSMISFDIQSDSKMLKKIYLSKSTKLANPSLETIFEVPQEGKVMSNRKLRRQISFQVQPKSKTKKRSMKAKHMISHYKRTNKKIKLDFLMEKLNSIEECD